MIFINGCSNEVKRSALSDICPNEERPNGDTKYKINPINNWVCIAAKPKIAIFLSFAVNSFLENSPINELITAIVKNIIAKYAQLE